VLTTRPYIRTVSEIRPEWLFELAANYYDASLFADGDTKRALQRVWKKSQAKAFPLDDKRPKKKVKAG
jgi:pre-mRNA-splicing factor ATP-dependent RNA helicase DHX15/PRP43